jgi:hypothetical protein
MDELDFELIRIVEARLAERPAAALRRATTWIDLSVLTAALVALLLR